MSDVSSTTRDSLSTDQSGLGSSMTMLSALVRLRVPFPEILQQVTVLATRAVSGADGAWLTWCVPGEAPLMAASRDGLRRLDQSQYQLDEGPSLAAFEAQQAVFARELDTDPRWPRFAARCATEGVCGVLAVSLTVDATRLGVLSVCSGSPGALGADSGADTALFAEHAAHSLANAHALAAAESKLTQLNEALSSRSLIEQAKGIVMAKEACSEQEAFDRLRAASQNGHVKLRLVAQLLVDSVAKERSRRSTPRIDARLAR